MFETTALMSEIFALVSDMAAKFVACHPEAAPKELTTMSFETQAIAISNHNGVIIDNVFGQENDDVGHLYYTRLEKLFGKLEKIDVQSLSLDLKTNLFRVLQTKGMLLKALAPFKYSYTR